MCFCAILFPMIEKTFVMTDPQGMHARPASAVVKVAKTFHSEITLIAEESVSLKNLMKVLSQGMKEGASFSIKVEGEDEITALEAITKTLIEQEMAREA